MYFHQTNRLLVATVVVAMGLSAALAAPGHGGGGGGGGGGHPSGGGGGGGFHGGGGGGGGGGGSHPSGGGGGGATFHSSGGGGSGSGSVHSSGVGSSGTHAASSGVSSSGHVGTAGGSGISASGVSGSATHSHSSLSGTTGGSAGSLHTGIGSHTPTFSPGVSSTVHTGGAGSLSGSAGLHSGVGGATTHTGSVGLHTGTGGIGTQHFNVGSGSASHVNIGSGTASHVNSGSATFHTGASGMHTGATFHGGFNPGTHANPGFHNAAFAHSPAMHVTNIGVAHFGNNNLHLAGAGYHPAYFHHSFYHGPWSGHGWGWGWGLGPAYGFGFGWGGGGFGLGWGYGGWGYGGYYGWGPYGYWGRPLGWGFGAWGLGTGIYSCGYYPYYNPYYLAPVGTTVVYNYASPIPVDTGVAVAVVPNAEQPIDPNVPSPSPVADNPDFDAARAAFSQADFGAALTNVDAAIRQVPTDAVLHEFRALVLFALLDYRQAAGVIHSVLAVGPGWDWTTMSALYSDPGLYAQQLRALEDYTLANPRAADAHFLLAYHYMVCNHKDATANQLQLVVQLQPNDKLAGELLKMVQGPPQQPAATAEPPDPTIGPQLPATGAENQPELPPIDKDLLPGRWSASRPDGSKFALTMTDEGQFTWKFSAPKQKGDEFSGTYTIDGPVLMLQRAGGGALTGVATFDGNNQFNFKMVGGPPEDKGLDFGK